MEADLIYYRRRCAEEAQAAALALNPRVRDIHVDLGRRYSERVAALEEERRQINVRLVTAA
jgi:hypothetical protein